MSPLSTVTSPRLRSAIDSQHGSPACSPITKACSEPLYLTATDSLDEQARQGLVNTNPQVVVLTGGTAALSTAVEQQVAAVLPDAEVRRFAGAGRPKRPGWSTR